MYCEMKGVSLWVWSSRKASLDCMPQFKFKTLGHMQAGLLAVTGIRGRKENRMRVYEAARDMRSERLYSWAANLNKG